MVNPRRGIAPTVLNCESEARLNDSCRRVKDGYRARISALDVRLMRAGGKESRTELRGEGGLRASSSSAKTLIGVGKSVPSRLAKDPIGKIRRLRPGIDEGVRRKADRYRVGDAR